MTASLERESLFQVVAGVEVNPDFADEWQHQNRAATLYQADIRTLRPTDYPAFDVLIGGIPCTSHSKLGRAKNALAGKPEVGETGDLFLPVAHLIAERMPPAVLLENVPSFANSLAESLLVTHLTKLGYHVSTTILKPNTEWQEIEDRRRWVLVATLDRPLVIRPPGLPCTTTVAQHLDAPDPVADRQDAQRIAGTIESLRRHNARHQAAGHGFAFTTLDGEESRMPVVPRSYHKINSGPFVNTPFGPRLLRQAEIERIHGCQLHTRDYATAVQILGQGVQTRIFAQMFHQLAVHLLGEAQTKSKE